MTEEKVTAREIVDWIQEQVQARELLGPSDWMRAAHKLNVLISDETDKLFEMQQAIAKLNLERRNNGVKATEVKTRMEASDQYKQMKQQEVFVRQIEEFIRLAKKQATLKDNEMAFNFESGS